MPAFAPVYLDYNATTPMPDAVREAMLPWLGRPANASSRHEYGRAARAALDAAREEVAAAVGAQAHEVVFTSGGSEANNLFIKGAAACLRRGAIAIGGGEHPCVREPARQLSRSGWLVHELALDAQGRVDLAAAHSLLAAHAPQLVSVMLANNETGVINPVHELVEMARAQGAWVHADAVQALGKQPIALRELGLHALSLSAHKIGGPQGVGALVVQRRVELEPLIAGGGQERGLRSGTENLAAIVGFGAACRLACAELAARAAHMAALQKQLEAGLGALGARIFGAGAARLPNTSFFAFPGLEGETLVTRLDRAGYAVASGSACSSASPEPSHTLLGMGIAPEIARAAVRVSVGAQTRAAEIEGFLQALQQTVKELRQLAAVAGT